MRNWLRPFSSGIFIALVLILLAQAAVSRAVTALSEAPLSSPHLETLPMQMGGWTAAGEGSLDTDVEQYLKPDNYIMRDYRSSAASGAPINLFVAYFHSLQSNYGPHSPRVCLPGNGWSTRSSAIRQVAMPGRSGAVPVNEYVMERDASRIAVLYWYQNKRNVWAEEFRAKLYLLPDLLRYRQFDVSLVRIITPLDRYASTGAAVDTATQFARTLFPMLDERFASAGN